jgi:hypothetical protein
MHIIILTFITISGIVKRLELKVLDSIYNKRIIWITHMRNRNYLGQKSQEDIHNMTGFAKYRERSAAACSRVQKQIGYHAVKLLANGPEKPVLYDQDADKPYDWEAEGDFLPVSTLPVTTDIQTSPNTALSHNSEVTTSTASKTNHLLILTAPETNHD